MTVPSARGSRDPYVGRVLEGRYRVGERIARGGMASVHEALDLRLDRPVAIKIMHPGLGDEPEFAARFVGEARSAARLSHPNVVAVHDQGEDDGTVFLAMELVRGRTLRDEIAERSPMRPNQALALLTPIVAALSAAHQAGLIHRDVKPENVLIADDGRVNVADFGLARAISSMTQHTATGMLIGTVSYIAPEIVVHGRSDARGDVYAAGVILYELLTGEKPHTGETAIQIAYCHVHHDVPAPSVLVPGLPPYVDALVARATARDPEHRPADARVLAHQLELVRQALAAGVADDPALTADLQPRRAPVDTAEMPTGGTGALADQPVPLTRERPEVAAHVIDEHPWEHSALAQMVPPAPPTSLPPARRASAVPPVAAPSAPVRRRSRRGPLLLVIALLLAVGLGGGAWWFGWARWTSTPGVLGLSRADAEQRLDRAGLDGAVAERRYSDTVPAGAVIASSPRPGDRSLDGASVDLVVSLGVEAYDVPTLAGRTEDQAQDAIAAAGLRFGRSTQAFSESAAAGTVISSSPEAGQTIRPSEPVDLVVSQGREPVGTRDWTGRNADRARTVLEKRGLVVEVTGVYSDDVASGAVVSQTPAAGAELYRGDTVTLSVSRGPELIAVPNGLVASGVEAATEALQAAGFDVRTRESDAYLGLGYVLGVEPGEGETIPKGSTVVLSLV